MPKLIVKGLGPLDGEYAARLDNFTNRELHEIKTISRVRAAEINEALLAGDSDLMLAMAVVTLRRHGRQPDLDELWDAEYGSVTFDFSDLVKPKGDALPPKKSPSGDDENDENDDSDGISGAASKSGSGSRRSRPPRTGSPG